jgi:hypothetical protein
MFRIRLKLVSYISIVFYGGSLGFVYQIMISRNLKDGEFAKYTSILSIIGIIALSISTLQKFVANEILHGRYVNSNRILDEISTKVIKWATPLLITILFLIDELLDFNVNLSYYLIIIYHLIYNIMISTYYGKLMATGTLIGFSLLGTLMTTSNIVILIILRELQFISLSTILFSQVALSIPFLIYALRSAKGKLLTTTKLGKDFFNKFAYILLVWIAISFDIILNPLINKTANDEYARFSTILRISVIVIFALTNYYFGKIISLNFKKIVKYNIMLFPILFTFIFSLIAITEHYHYQIFGKSSTFSLEVMGLIVVNYILINFIIINMNFLYNYLKTSNNVVIIVCLVAIYMFLIMVEQTVTGYLLICAILSSFVLTYVLDQVRKAKS